MNLLHKVSVSLDEDEARKNIETIQHNIQGRESSAVPVYVEEAEEMIEAVGEDLKERWEKIVKSKDELEFEEDFFAYTVLCYT